MFNWLKKKTEPYHIQVDYRLHPFDDLFIIGSDITLGVHDRDLAEIIGYATVGPTRDDVYGLRLEGFSGAITLPRKLDVDFQIEGERVSGIVNHSGEIFGSSIDIVIASPLNVSVEGEHDGLVLLDNLEKKGTLYHPTERATRNLRLYSQGGPIKAMYIR